MVTLEKAINIISFDVPWPANYGGVIDVYYKLVWLKKMGVKIHLHCFTYGRKPSAELAELCEKVYYYPRKTGFFSNLSSLPYTVKSRQSEELAENLLTNDYPILFEVLHTCYLMGDERFKNRKKIYRHSNIEHDYYRHLAKAEKKLFKKVYLNLEARKLEKFESVIAGADSILAVNEEDAEYFRKKYPSVKTFYIPSFHSNDHLNSRPGKGDYLLYHGNLSVPENYEAAEWLIKNVFSGLKKEVIIAGLNPPEFLKEEIKKHQNLRLRENPSDIEMQDLIRQAHIHCLYTKQATGLKLKLLNVLFNGRFVICNAEMVSGTGFQSNAGLIITSDFKKEIEHLNGSAFTETFIKERSGMLEKFSNENNIKKLVDAVFV